MMWAAGASSGKTGRRYSWPTRKRTRHAHGNRIPIVARYGAFIAAVIFLGSGIGVIVYGKTAENIFFYVFGGILTGLGAIVFIGACYTFRLQVMQEQQENRRKAADTNTDVEANGDKQHNHHSDGHHERHHHGDGHHGRHHHGDAHHHGQRHHSDSHHPSDGDRHHSDRHHPSDGQRHHSDRHHPSDGDRHHSDRHHPSDGGRHRSDGHRHHSDGHRHHSNGQHSDSGQKDGLEVKRSGNVRRSASPSSRNTDRSDQKPS